MGFESPKRRPLDLGELFPKPKTPQPRKDPETGDLLYFISPKNRQLLMDAVAAELKRTPSFGEAFRKAFKTTAWQEGVVDQEHLGAYAQVVHDAYGEEWRPQDNWFYSEVAPSMESERAAMDAEAGEYPGQSD